MTHSEWRLQVIKEILRRRDQSDRQTAQDKMLEGLAPFASRTRPMTAHEAFDEAIDVIVRFRGPDDTDDQE